MKGLVWATAVLAAVSALALLGVRQRQGALLVSPPPAIAATALARCPDFTLEDNGVCLPLPRPTSGGKPPGKVDWVSAEALLSAFYVPWRDAPVPQQLIDKAPAEFRALLVRTRVGSEVRCATSLPDPVVSHIGKAPDDTWVLTVGSKADPARTVSIANLTALAPNVLVDSPCANGTILGTSGDALVVWEGNQ
jgi:hypothetical protein